MVLDKAGRWLYRRCSEHAVEKRELEEKRRADRRARGLPEEEENDDEMNEMFGGAKNKNSAKKQKFDDEFGEWTEDGEWKASSRADGIDGDWDSDDYGGVDGDEYFVADFVADWNLNERVAVFGRVENLFDLSYEPADGYPALGRSVYFGARCRF